MYVNTYNNCLTGFHEPLSPLYYRCHTTLKMYSTISGSLTALRGKPVQICRVSSTCVKNKIRLNEGDIITGQPVMPKFPGVTTPFAKWLNHLTRTTHNNPHGFISDVDGRYDLLDSSFRAQDLVHCGCLLLSGHSNQSHEGWGLKNKMDHRPTADCWWQKCPLLLLQCA